MHFFQITSNEQRGTSNLKKLTGIAEIELFLRLASTCQYTLLTNLNPNPNLNLYPQVKEVSYKKCISSTLGHFF